MDLPSGIGTAIAAFLAVRLGGRMERAPRFMGESNEWLIARAANGDGPAFDEIYRRHVDRIWGLVTRLMGQESDREDVVQQVFLELFRSMDNFRGEASLSTYLYRIATNAAFEHLAKRSRRAGSMPISEAAEIPDPSVSPERRTAGREQLSLVWRLLDRIKPKKRIAFLLRTVDGLSLAEIGEAVGAHPDAVAQRIRHASAELGTLMAKRGVDS